MPFFSPNPAFFHNPRNCSLDNGTTIYSNHAIPSDCSCVAPFRAEPEFGGPGIIAFFCFFAWVTIFVAGVPASYSVRKSWAETRRDEKGWRRSRWKERFRWVGRFLIDALQLKIKAQNQPPQTAPDSSSGDISSETAKLEMTNLGSLEQQNLRFEEPPLLELAKVLLVSLTDLQIVAGLAYMVAGMSEIRTISYYHEQFVVNLWWLSQNSLWVSRIDYNSNTPATAHWRYTIRRIVILLSVFSSAVFQAIVTVRERWHWDPTSPRHCYNAGGFRNSFSQNMFWLTGTCFYAASLCLGITTWTRRKSEEVTDYTDSKIVALWGSLTRSCNELSSHHNHHTSSRRSLLVAKIVVKALLLGLCWAMIQFLAIWCAGTGPPLLEMVIYFLFALQSTFWVILLKVVNKELVLGNDNKWTFGQTLAILLSFLVLFSTLDSKQGKRWAKR